MNLVECNEGHFYDKNMYKTCPYCVDRESEMILSKLKEYEPLGNKWYFDSLIGQGATGRVYKLTDKEKQHFSAVKVILIKKSIRNLESGELFEINEKMQLLYLLNGNNNIVNTLNHYMFEDLEYVYILIQMELLMPITEYFYSDGISEKKAINLAIDICLALQYCEKIDIVHRDIKPQNIFFSSQNSTYKLGDFGLAENIENLRDSKSIKGTISYLAPEIITNREYSFQSDIYSLGVVLYQLMNGNILPYQNSQDSNNQQKKYTIIGELEFQDLMPPRYSSSEFTNVIMKACQRDPKLRYKSVNEMLIDLKSINNAIEGNLKYYPCSNEKTQLTESTLVFADDIEEQFHIEESEFNSYHSGISDNSKEPKTSNAPIKRVNTKMIIMRLVNWFCFTCIMSLIPIIIFAICRELFAPEAPYLEKCINDFIVFSMSISVITIRDIFSERLWNKEKVISLLSVFINVVLLIFSTVIIGILTVDLLELINIDINNKSLFNFSIILCIISFLTGTLIQIWEEL